MAEEEAANQNVAEEEEADEKTLLLEAWQKRGAVKFNDFEKVSDTARVQLLREARQLGPEYSVSYADGTAIEISDETYKMEKVSASAVAKKLLLLSGQNGVAAAIKRYLHLHYECKVMRVRKKKFYQILINFLNSTLTNAKHLS